MILQYLKENTKGIHHEVEQDNLAKYIMDHSISKDDYKKLLIQNFKFYHSIEETLIRSKHLIHPSLHPFIDQDKTERLRKDLSHLNYEFKIQKNQSNHLPINSGNAALGMLYVSEGSALGGLMISKHLGKCLNLNSIETHSFFGKNVPVILARWKKFQQVVEQYFQDDTIKEETLNSANATLKLFGEIIRE